jgi:hypothetical protein
MRLKKIAALLLMLTLIAVLPVFAATFPLTLHFHTAVLDVNFPTAGDSTVGNRGIETTPQKGTTDSGGLDFTGNLYSVSVPDGVAFYAIGYFDYTGGSISSDAINEAIDGAWANSGNVEVPGSRVNTRMAGLFARESVGTTDTLDSFVRAAVVGNRLFLAVVVANKSVHFSQDEADEYFDTISRN